MSLRKVSFFIAVGVFDRSEAPNFRLTMAPAMQALGEGGHSCQMRETTIATFHTLREAIERWSVASKHRDAYVRGSQARRDLADQIRGYKRIWGRAKLMEILRLRLADENAEITR